MVFSYYYVKYDRIIARRFEGPVFASAAKIYATPRSIAVGEKAELKEIAAELRHTGYSDKDGQSTMGGYHLSAGPCGKVIAAHCRLTVLIRIAGVAQLCRNFL